MNIFQYRLGSEGIELDVLKDAFKYDEKRGHAYIEEVDDYGQVHIVSILSINEDEFTHYSGLGDIDILHYTEKKDLEYIKKIMNKCFITKKADIKRKFHCDMEILEFEKDLLNSCTEIDLC